MLAAEGETILYISTHGPLEKGKDIITRTAGGEIHAYQLKAGNVGLREWREIYGEIVNLVELAIELPGTPPITEFVPYLVTNGELTDPVLEQVRTANVTWQSRGISKQLRIVQKGGLFERFRASHGAYLPNALADFRVFLELLQRDGSAPAEKEKAAELIEHVLPQEPERETALNISRAAASIVLLAAYITGPSVLASNHWCVFEYWVLFGAYVLHLAEKSTKDSSCQVSFELCETAAEDALSAIAEESAQRANLVQGLPLLDGHAYRARVTILAGLLSAWDLSLRIRRKPRKHADFVQSFLNARLKEASMWGESAVPYLFAAALEAERNCRSHVAEGLAIQLVREISTANGAGATGRGISNPYYSPERALRLSSGLDFLNLEQFVGFSYTIAALVDFLARRWRRQGLANLWFGITRMSLLSYVPANFAEWFKWHSSDGVLSSRLPGEPQSWELLRTSAETMAVEELPPTLLKRPAFALWFVLVYPHRFTPAIAKLIEDAIGYPSGRTMR